MNLKYRNSCRICGNTHLTEVIDLGDMHFQGSFNKPGFSPAPKRKIPNKVVRCDTSKNENACGLVQTEHTVPPEILYSNYHYLSGVSQTMRDHLRSIVKEVLSIVPNPERVLDCGMNDGTLLLNYPDNIVLYGVDPSDISANVKSDRIKVINTIFPCKQLGKSKDFFDVITSIACFYDIEDPKAFAQEIERLLTEKGVWIFEVAYWKSMVDNLMYDSIVNEHICHYHLAPLEILFKSVGLKLFRAEKTDTNGGSVMCYVCKDSCFAYERQEWKNNLGKIRLEEFDAGLDQPAIYVDFKKRVEAQADELFLLLSNLVVSQGKKVQILGASTKGNTLLEYIFNRKGKKITDYIQYAMERSVNKHGAETIYGIKIISEEESRAMKPDYYLVLPYHFKKEILQREKKTVNEDGIKLIIPLPKVEVVDRV